MWYRVELNKDGSVKSCDEVESRLSGTRWVQYIHSDTKEQAIAQAIAWLNAYREKQRNALRRRRREYRSKGMCDCGLPVDTDGVTCSRCRVKNRREMRNRYLESKGESPVGTTKPKREAFADRKELERAIVRCSVLDEVLTAYSRMHHKTFGKWLKAEALKASEAVDRKKSAA